MKKVIAVLLILITAMIFTACGNNSVNIEECDWELQSVTNLNNNENMTVDNITLTAKNGEIAINDTINGKVYKGAYDEMLVTDITNDYKIIVEGKEGYVSITEGENGEITLLLTVDNYDLSFSAK